ncbi:MAG: transporter substrate-binding protein [Candidatus Magnetominusculus sp. LBB02]|nr:transporter substrate-binding protein [Candidatus Magnetominusculus sp. LBB02]
MTTGSKTVQIGVLHSLTGRMAINEAPLVDAILMAVDEINASGGLLGYRIEPLTEDGASSPSVFKDKAQRLFDRHKVSNVFGCWQSSERKTIKPIVEAHDGLLWYPAQYEGLEESLNIVYSGGCLNQLIEPAIEWAFMNKCTSFFLIGSDNVFPHTANLLARTIVEERGGKIVQEQYTATGNTDFTAAIKQIQDIKPDIILNTLNGQSNISFYKQYSEAGGSIPALALNISDVQVLERTEYARGHYACCGYFQSLNINENHIFIDKFRTKYGGIISDAVISAYSQVYLWKQAVETAMSFDTRQVRAHLHGQRFLSPGGDIQVEPNNHIRKKAYIGLLDNNGQFQIVWDSVTAIKPKPWLGIEQAAAMPSKNLIKNVLCKLPQLIHDKIGLEERAADDLRKKEQLLIQKSKLSSLGENINNIVHQWKQPLNAIALKIQDITDAYACGELDDMYLNDLVETTMQQIHFMSKTMEDFRNFSLPSKIKKRFDVKSAIDELLSMFLNVYRMHNIDVSLNVEQGSALITKGCPNEFKQVVLNLLNNSKDAVVSRIKSGCGVKGHIDINIANSDDKSYVLISVRDNGGGIAANVAGHIFEPYVTTKKDNEGTGIGLYMSKTIVETNMGGTLTGRNITNGAEFVIMLNTSITTPFAGSTVSAKVL